MVAGDFESQASDNGGTNGSTLVATTILHPKVRNLAFAASYKAQKIILKQAADGTNDDTTASRGPND